MCNGELRVYIYIERYRFRYTDKNGNIVKGLHETDGVMDTPMVPMTKYHDEFSWLTRRSCQKSTHLSSLGVIPTTLNTGKSISNSDRRFLTWNLHWGMYVYIYTYIHTYMVGYESQGQLVRHSMVLNNGATSTSKQTTLIHPSFIQDCSQTQIQGNILATVSITHGNITNSLPLCELFMTSHHNKLKHKTRKKTHR